MKSQAEAVNVKFGWFNDRFRINKDQDPKVFQNLKLSKKIFSIFPKAKKKMKKHVIKVKAIS